MPYRVILVAVLAVLASGAGCSDSASPAEHVDVHAIRVMVDTQTVTIEDGGAVTGGPLVIQVGEIGLTAQFLDRAGKLAPVHPAEYRVEIASSDEDAVTFARRTAFAGTLTGVAAGSAQLAVCLLHVASEQCEVGSRTAMVLPVTVAQPDTGDDGDGGDGDGDGSDDGEGEGA